MSKDPAVFTPPSDAETVKRVRRWLDSHKEGDIDMRDLRRVCWLAEQRLIAPSETAYSQKTPDGGRSSPVGALAQGTPDNVQGAAPRLPAHTDKESDALALARDYLALKRTLISGEEVSMICRALVAQSAGVSITPWADDVPLRGPDAPKNDGKIKHLIEYLMTVYKRFGNTLVTVDLQWGATALHKLDAERECIETLEAELAALRSTPSARTSNLIDDVNELRTLYQGGKVLTALEESLKLQSHYATLLNMHDGGQRMTFPTVEAWLARLEEVASPDRKAPHG